MLRSGNPTLGERKLATIPCFCDQCGARLSANTRFCEACGAPVADASTASALPPTAAKQAVAARRQPVAKHGLRWAALLALGAAGIASWLWLPSPESAAPTAVQVAPAAPAVQIPALADAPAPPEVSAADRLVVPPRLPAEAVDAESLSADPIAAEHRAAQSRFDRAYRAYTVLITEGGSGDVIEARDEYAAAYEDLKRIEALHPELAQ